MHISLQVFVVQAASPPSSGLMRSRRLLQGSAQPTTNMAATDRMRTWSCRTRGVFYPWILVFIISLTTINVAVAAPETGLWNVTVVNVSIRLGMLWENWENPTGQLQHQIAIVSYSLALLYSIYKHVLCHWRRLNHSCLVILNRCAYSAATEQAK